MNTFWRDFRAFAVKGDVMNLAIAVVVGNAFSGVVNSLVSGILTPLLGLLTGNIDLKNLSLALTPQSSLAYGSFLQAVINFLIISLSIFVVFNMLSSMRRKLWREGEKAVPPAQKPPEERLLEEIRDLLKQEVASAQK